MKQYFKFWFIAFLGMSLFVLNSCEKKSDVQPSQPFDPNKPVLISDFIPKEGGADQQLVIKGDNFGNDTSIVKVLIGGKLATLIGVKNDALYCLVPSGAFDGDIQVIVGDENQQSSAKADEVFVYQRKMLVSTLCGQRDNRGNYDIKDGPFDDCGGFQNPSWLVFDPGNPDVLWMGQDGGDIRTLNFGDSMVSTPITRGMGNWGRIRSIDFTLDHQYMIVAEDQGDVNGISTSILSRAKNFKDPQILTSYKQCNGATVHPVNGELYFNSYEKGQFFRFDLDTYFKDGLDRKDYKELFKIQDNSWEFNIRIHPSGDYAYIVVINQHYILRTDYNWTTKEFMTPYVVCGQPRTHAYVDGVGTSARLYTPYQGVFVKNQDYVDEGRDDVYDFYFTEQNNHDIRILTPNGKVKTFAGRGSPSLNSDAWGYIDGDLRTEARFDQPKGLVYDEANETFYIGDASNHVIRKIAREK